MYSIYVDDMRVCPSGYDKACRTTNETLNCVQKQYKAGTRNFLLDLDYDAGDEYAKNGGGDYINILKSLEDLQRSGKYKSCKFYVKLHTQNVVGRMNMKAYLKEPWFYEVN